MSKVDRNFAPLEKEGRKAPKLKTKKTLLKRHFTPTLPAKKQEKYEKKKCKSQQQHKNRNETGVKNVSYSKLEP